MLITTIALASLIGVMADVKQNQELPVRYPSTFGYAALEAQKKADPDQFLRSNIDNEANKRNAQKEAAVDMLPFRQPEVGPVRALTRGVPIRVPLTWNNPHDSDCEVNAFINGQRDVVPLRRPSPNGGGYTNHEFSYTFPLDFPGCALPSDGCVVQIYCHSVETRTYAIGYDFVLLDQPREVVGNVTKRQYNKYDVPKTIIQPAIHYWDSFDTSHTDSQFSQYRGQQRQYVRDEVLAAIELRCHLGNGGLVPLGPVNPQRAALEAKVNAAIQAAEQIAIKQNQAAQAALDASRTPGTPRVCFQGELYSVVNNPECTRQYTNTYVTNVGYRQLVNQFLPQFEAAKLSCYQAKLKSNDFVGKTPFDPYGSMADKNGKPIISYAPTTTRYVPPTTTFVYVLPTTTSSSSIGYNMPSSSSPVPSSTRLPLTATTTSTAGYMPPPPPSSTALPLSQTTYTVVYGVPYTTAVPSETAAPITNEPPRPTEVYYPPPAPVTTTSEANAANTRAPDTEVSGSRGVTIHMSSLFAMVVPLLLAL